MVERDLLIGGDGARHIGQIQEGIGYLDVPSELVRRTAGRVSGPTLRLTRDESGDTLSIGPDDDRA